MLKPTGSFIVDWSRIPEVDKYTYGACVCYPMRNVDTVANRIINRLIKSSAALFQPITGPRRACISVPSPRQSDLLLSFRPCADSPMCIHTYAALIRAAAFYFRLLFRFLPSIASRGPLLTFRAAHRNNKKQNVDAPKLGKLIFRRIGSREDQRVRFALGTAFRWRLRKSSHDGTLFAEQWLIGVMEYIIIDCFTDSTPES